LQFGKLEMNKYISKISGYFNLQKIKSDKRIIVFAVCLLIAMSLWFLNALSKDYSETLTFSVKYVNPPKNLFLAGTPPSKIELNVQAHGFTLLRHKLAFSFAPIIFDLSSFRQDNPGAGNTISVSSADLIRRIQNQVSKEILVTDITPRILTLTFDSLETKTVPITARVKYDFKPQHNQKGAMVLDPDSIHISGPSGVIDTILALQTEAKTFHNLDAGLTQVLQVKHPFGTSITPEYVTLQIPVERYTEKELTLPLEIRNKPEQVNIKLFPPQIRVAAMVGLSDYENLSPDSIKALVDYEQILAGQSSLDVIIETKPDFVYLLKTTPASVEYLIETE